MGLDGRTPQKCGRGPSLVYDRWGLDEAPTSVRRWIPVTLMFLNGTAMWGQKDHSAHAGSTFLGPARTAARHRVFAVRAEFPRPSPPRRGGGLIDGGLSDLPGGVLPGPPPPAEPPGVRPGAV